ncbi:16S rRNA (cytosine(1402)-N(4))-methyltransferase RsmH [Candidatus Uhrbacteria bacterium]|nr:16S rRNA (cytosine(1402)-N(4))-methyltransferase RsmH [Candidatus Uhrbacteria bacterium]
MAEFCHVPVLTSETLHFLDPKPGERFIDATVGQGGHAEQILSRILPGGRLLAIDRDATNLDTARRRLERFGDPATFVRDSYERLAHHAMVEGFEAADGILLDVGFSSVHVEDPERGFSFQAEGPLDMRYDTGQELMAAQIVNAWTKEELVRLFRVYGEEPQALRIAEAIIQRRRKGAPFRTTTDLAETIAGTVPRRGRIHPATRVFQALRIAVNGELDALQAVLPQAVGLLRPGGRLVVISFHSLEDRIVKRFFKYASGAELRILTKRVVTPTEDEIKKNARARSAKLRAAERM